MLTTCRPVEMRMHAWEDPETHQMWTLNQTNQNARANTVVPQGPRVLGMDGCVATYTPNLEV